MTEQQFIILLEEMIDLKIQQHVSLQRPGKPELAGLVQQKRFEDQVRLLEIRNELMTMFRD